MIVVDRLGKYPPVGAVASSLGRQLMGVKRSTTQQVGSGSRLADSRDCAIFHADTMRSL